MNGDLSLAYTLMATGMVMVFIILLIVVLIGNLTILFVNKIVSRKNSAVSVGADIQSGLESKTIAALFAGVSEVVSFKGRIVKIEKIVKK